MAEALQQPDVLVEEYKRRLVDSGATNDLEFERKQMTIALRRIKAREDRITDGSINEAMDLKRYKAEMDKLKAERQQLEQTAKDIDRRMQQGRDSQDSLRQLERFCNDVAQGLEAMTFEKRQQLLQLVVEKITVDDGRVKVETVIPISQEYGKLCPARGKRVEP